MTYVPPPSPQYGYGPSDPTNVMGRRILAHLIDIILVVVFAIMVVAGTARTIKNLPDNYCTTSGNGHPNGCVQIGHTAYVIDTGRQGTSLLVAGGYWTIVGMIEGATGAFLGKRITGLRVVNASGSLAGVGRGAARGVLMLIDSTFCFLIGLITASVTHPHRRIGDMAAGTFVVAKESVGRPVTAGPATYVPYAPPPAATAPGRFEPGTYGTSHPPFAQTTPTPSPAPAPSPTGDVPHWGAPPQPASEQAGWAAPVPPQNGGWSPAAPAPQPAPPPAAPPAPPPVPPQPQWDAARNAWIVWDPARGAWLQWDAASNQWGPIS